MTMKEAAKLAKKAQVKEMWLTHFSPSLVHPEEYMDGVREIFPNSYVGKDGNPWICYLRRKKMSEKDVLILAIESSCDETAASVVKNGRTILSNVISSQIALHTLYGGVVPEIASRKHIEK